MGLPMVQVFMIAARQISRPVADRVLQYGKTHSVFRNRMLIPLGRGLVHLTTRLRMKNLGLGAPANLAPVSEETALEQASEFVQQIVLFTYSVGVFASYYFYTKVNSPETMRAEEFDDFKRENDEKIDNLICRLERLEELLQKQNSSKSSQKNTCECSVESVKEEESETVASARPRFKRISSLPVDEAARVVLSEANVLLAADVD